MAGFRLRRVTASILNDAYPARSRTARKGDYGRLLVIGGSETYTGAPGLAAGAAVAAVSGSALNAGTDLVHVFAPRRVADAIAGYAPDFITHASSKPYLAPSDLKSALEHAAHSTSVVIGNGAGTRPQTQQFTRRFVEQCPVPVVVDADGIRAIANERNRLRRAALWRNAQIVTPNAREFEAMTGAQPPAVLNARIALVKRWASTLETTVVLKGREDVISNGLQTAVNRTGNAFMTKGGLGDTLAGLAGAFLAVGRNPFDAACAAAFVNGAAGTLAAKRFGVSLTASRLIASIPDVLKHARHARL